MLRTFAPFATAHSYCARKFTRRVMRRAMIGQMAIATPLRGSDDFGRSVTPTFLSSNIFCLQLLSTHVPSKTKSMILHFPFLFLFSPFLAKVNHCLSVWQAFGR